MYAVVSEWLAWRLIEDVEKFLEKHGIDTPTTFHDTDYIELRNQFESSLEAYHVLLGDKVLPPDDIE